MTPLSTVQPTRAAWEVEMVSQRTESGIVLFEYLVRGRGGDPFLLNNHKAQLRENHQRIKLDPDDKMLHVSGVAVDDPEDFLANDSRAYRWVDKDNSGNWRDDQGRVLAPYIFPTAPWAGSRDEELDPQWQREQFTVPLQGQIDNLIERYLARAEAHGWVGDRRGTTLNLKVGAGADDAFERTSGFNGTATVLLCNSNTTNTEADTGARFTNVTVPNAATINSATLSVWAVHVDLDDANVTLHCEDVDDAANFVDTADVTGRARTSAGATWTADSLGAGKSVSPDFKSAPQAVVNRAGWVSGKAMVAFLDGKTDIEKFFRLESYEGDSSEAVELDIDYTAAAGGGIAPHMDYYRRRRVA